jgi:hypothetical protein
VGEGVFVLRRVHPRIRRIKKKTERLSADGADKADKEKIRINPQICANCANWIQKQRGSSADGADKADKEKIRINPRIPRKSADKKLER